MILLTASEEEVRHCLHCYGIRVDRVNSEVGETNRGDEKLYRCAVHAVATCTTLVAACKEQCDQMFDIVMLRLRAK